MIEQHINKMESQPCKYDFYNVLEPRLTSPSNDLLNTIRRTKKGVAGENDVISIFTKYGRKHWMYFSNLWLNKNGRIEVDLLVVTNTSYYVSEIKNYDDYFSYDHGVCQLGDLILDEDCISQTRRTYSKFKNLCRQENIFTDVHGAIIFIGENCQVKIGSQIDSIKVISRNQLRDYIKEMMLDEKNNFQNNNQSSQLNSMLNNNIISDPFLPDSLVASNSIKLKYGIHCANCNNFDLYFHKQYVECKCGLFEPREEAMVRSICEYGVLNYDQNLVKMKILEFIDYQCSYNYLDSILNKHFEPIQSAGTIEHVNPINSYKRIYNHFNFNLLKKHYIKAEDYLFYISN